MCLVDRNPPFILPAGCGYIILGSDFCLAGIYEHDIIEFVFRLVARGVPYYYKDGQQ